MSSYQGEKFILEQLESILVQLPADGRILIRDDGSRDRTMALVESLNEPRVTTLLGENLGFGASFLTLLAMAPTDTDMVMFADQDDVWLPGKVDRAWQHLLPLASGPALYGSAQMLVDEHLRPLHRTPPWPRGPSLAGALTENIITGCTAAINRPALEVLQQGGVPAGVRFHDWWLYLVISAFGTVVYDDEPTLLYRQHGANQIGHGAGWWGRHQRMVRFVWRNDWVGILLAQVSALLRHYGHRLDPTARDLVNQYFALIGERATSRWRLIFSRRRWRQSALRELALRLLLALHKLRLWPLSGRRL